MAASAHDIDKHPDVLEMRHRYDEISEKPIAQWADGVMFLAGIFLAMSPWVIGFSGQASMTASCLITGLAVALLGVGFSVAYGHFHGLAWVTGVLGLWAIVSPWAVDGPTPDNKAIVWTVIAGALCVLCTLALMSTSMERLRMGRR
ncbi:SPW repeat protein [Luteipulveratus mongoliensis]|uniref:SPW repeat-containing integral membrane domain-containing protein n=1 Tax=Luteipulveratus mongoliensis TaxID=571913 RepID=A0A0K1JMB6_9MICO|nr:SPW repeat protein [Luteipulveratus mongoliensis]AKU17861.1 hypothetical protein VV02_21685 [Luteipulveratus mongoliensis]